MENQQGGTRHDFTAHKAQRRNLKTAIVGFIAAEACVIAAILAAAFGLEVSDATLAIAAAILTAAVFALVLGAYFYNRSTLAALRQAEEGRLSAESDLAAALENERVLFNAPRTASILIDPDGLVLAANARCSEMFGRAADGIVGSRANDLMPADLPSDRAGWADMMRRASKPMEFMVAHKGRDYRYNIVPAGEDSGRVPRIAIFVEDVTEALELARKTGESEQLYRTLFESSLDGIVYTDTNGLIIDCNQSYAKILGYEVDELTGKNVWELTPLEWQSVDREVIEHQLMPSGFSDRYEKKYRRRDGSLVPVNLRVWATYDSMGRIVGAWARVEDISERKQYEDFIRQTIIRLEQANDRLREADSLKTEFVATVSHELRAPLGVVESSMAALNSLGDRVTDEQRAELLALVERGVRRLGRLVDDLLDITRIESGQLRLEVEQVNIVEVAERVLKSFEGRFADRGVGIILERLDTELAVQCDPHRVEQVLTNLVDNAMKFTGKGLVRVRLEGTPSRVICSVSDSGPGVPPALQQKVFEKFFTSEQPDGSQGVGLGLAISRGIVEAHGGSMWVENLAGSGATFGFELPL